LQEVNLSQGTYTPLRGVSIMMVTSGGECDFEQVGRNITKQGISFSHYLFSIYVSNLAENIYAFENTSNMGFFYLKSSRIASKNFKKIICLPSFYVDKKRTYTLQKRA
jgi:hypothetical protein